VKAPLEMHTVVAILKEFEVNEQNRVAAMPNRGGTHTNLFCTATYSRNVLNFDSWPAEVNERCRVHAVILVGHRKDALHCVCVTVSFASHCTYTTEIQTNIRLENIRRGERIS